MKCSGCGAQLSEGARFCSYCGTEAAASSLSSFSAEKAAAAAVQHIHIHHHHYEDEPQVIEKVVEQVVYERPVCSPRNRVVLLVLYFMLGVFGAHKFYAGRMGMGFLYLFTGGIFGIGLFCDFFSILLGTPKDAQGLPILWNNLPRV